MAVLYWLAELRSPILNIVMQFFTLFGEELVFTVLALVIFWCVDKREGYYLLFIGFFGTLINQFLKILCRIPRPWVRDPEFTIVESARGSATGYSFPSGHTQNVVGTLGGIARWHKNCVFRAVCLAVVALCAVSRMYLGVHTPWDVGVSFVVATVLVFAFYPLVRHCVDEPKRMAALLAVMTAAALAFVLYVNLAAFPVDIDPDNLYEARKNSFSLLGALLGFCLSYPLERRYVRFEEKAAWPTQIIKVVAGLCVLLAIKSGLKAFFAAVGLTWVGLNAVRYFAVVLFAALVWPLTFPWLCRKMERKPVR